MLSLVSDAIRTRVKLPKRAAQRKAVEKFAKNAWFEDSMFHPGLLDRAAALTRKTTRRPERDAFRKKIKLAVGNKIPLTRAAQRRHIRVIIKMIDHLYMNNTIEDGLVAWKSFKSGRKFSTEADLPEDKVRDGITGYTEMDQGEFKVSIDYSQLLGAMKKKSSVGSITCKRRLDCLILLIEHEVCHMFEFLFHHTLVDRGLLKGSTQIGDPHGIRFRGYLRRMFGQRTIDHDI